MKKNSDELNCTPSQAKGAGCVFKQEWFEVVEQVPAGGRVVSFYDLAVNAKSSAVLITGVKTKKVDGVYYVLADNYADEEEE